MVQGVAIEEGKIVDVNPATGEVLDRVPVSTDAEVQAAVERARRAQPAWAALPLAERAARLRAAIQRLKAGEAELAELITREMGKVLSEAKVEVEGAVNKDEFIALVQ